MSFSEIVAPMSWAPGVSFLGVILPFLMALGWYACQGFASDNGPGDAVRDVGWTSPWIDLGGDSGDALHTQSDVVAEGDMALGSTGTGSIERRFPDVSNGIFKTEMDVRLENPTPGIYYYNTIRQIPDQDLKKFLAEHPTTGLNHPDDSVLKVYVNDTNGDGGSALRWHCPYAWPEVGGNSHPRFYAIDGNGQKRKGLEFTDFFIEAGKWYHVETVLDFTAKTWQFWVDGAKFDYPAKFGREMSWWKPVDKVNSLRLTTVHTGKVWIDAIKIWHGNSLIASTGFNRQDGYEAGQPIAGRPKPD